MMDHTKYGRLYKLPPYPCDKWVRKDYIDHAPCWCSVDLRDGNQALVVPMTLEQKLLYFQMLVKIGFKEIEVGFPASSETEFQFLRALIDQDLIPEDVTVQVLTQAREHIIRRTFEALRGAKRAIVHLYNAVSEVQRSLVFQKSGEETIQMAVEGARLLYQLTEEYDASYRFEYSPESFNAVDPEYTVRICSAVIEAFKPTPDRRVIINLPSTVELSLPHVFAEQIEYISEHLPHRENVVLSVHPHNDRGCAAASAELALLAGAQRIEGTLFGNGERTGNVDLATLAMNLYAHGVDPELDFTELSDICDQYESYTGMKVDERRPYSGALVFAAFSGSHQDAVAKVMKYRENHPGLLWNVPYLLIDPDDIGKSRDADVIRINSQSGKGGVGFILEQHYGLRLPKKMREAMSYAAKNTSDLRHRELQPEALFDLFKSRYENGREPFEITEVHFRQHNGIIAEVSITFEGRKSIVIAHGNGRLNAVNNALKKMNTPEYDLVVYEEHALEKSSRSRAIAYVGVQGSNEEIYWGAGVDVDIIKASIDALVTAVNHLISGIV